MKQSPLQRVHSPRVAPALRCRHPLAALLAFSAWLAASVATAAIPSSTPREDYWITNGPVHSVIATSGTIYIGGDFTAVGPVTGPGVPLDLATGQPVTTFPRVAGSVLTCIPDGSGGWYIGGFFTKVGE